MTALQSFFKKYHAVPATDRGPEWDKADSEALLGWAKADLELWAGTTLREADRKHLKARMEVMRNELFWRMAETPEADRQSTTELMSECQSLYSRQRRVWWALCKVCGFLSHPDAKRPEKKAPSAN